MQRLLHVHGFVQLLAQLALAGLQRGKQFFDIAGHAVERVRHGLCFGRGASRQAHGEVAFAEAVGRLHQPRQQAPVRGQDQAQQEEDQHDIDGAEDGLFAYPLPYLRQGQAGRVVQGEDAVAAVRQRHRQAAADGRDAGQASEPRGHRDRHAVGQRFVGQHFDMRVSRVPARGNEAAVQRQGAAQHLAHAVVHRVTVRVYRQWQHAIGQEQVELPGIALVARLGQRRFRTEQGVIANGGNGEYQEENRKKEAGINSHPHP